MPLRVRLRQRYRPLLVPASKASQAVAAKQTAAFPLIARHMLVNLTIVAYPVVVAVRPVKDFFWGANNVRRRSNVSSRPSRSFVDLVGPWSHLQIIL